VFFNELLDEEGRPWVQVGLDYESGVLVILNPAPEDWATSSRAMASEIPGMSLQTVLGKPALVVKRDVGGTGNPGAVAIVVEGVEVGIYGQFASIEAPTLVQVAETVSA
jgi:hypothetical protein